MKKFIKYITEDVLVALFAALVTVGIFLLMVNGARLVHWMIKIIF